MLQSSKSNNKKSKNKEGNFEPGKRMIEENIDKEPTMEEIFDIATNYYLDSIDIEREEDSKLKERLKKLLKIEDDNIVIFTPQFIFAKNLRIIIKDKRINQNEFEEKYKLGKKMLSKYINGHQFPDINTMCKIAYGLNMSVYQLLSMSQFTSMPVDEINKITGLSEKAMWVLFSLHHNNPECEELTNSIPVSNVHKMKIDIFNSLIEDNANFLNFLSRLEQYTKLKSKLQKIEKEDDEYTKKEKKKNNREIKDKLLRIKRRII